MYGTVAIAEPKQEATVPSRVLRIILDNFAARDHLPDLSSADHSVRPKHLPERMGKKEHFRPCCLSDLMENIRTLLHAQTVLPANRLPRISVRSASSIGRGLVLILVEILEMWRNSATSC